MSSIDSPTVDQDLAGPLSKVVSVTLPPVRRPRIAILSAALPPKIDGIGDHSTHLAKAFAAHADVCIYTGTSFVPEAMEGIEIVPAFDPSNRKSIQNLIQSMGTNQPDWLIVQYNPFCFGPRGFNPYFPGVLKRLKEQFRQMHLAVMVHEMHMPANTLRNAVMSLAQWWQFAAVTSQADVAIFSTGPWLEAYQNRHAGRRAVQMPVGSNVTLTPADRQEVRAELNLPPQAIVLGTFGGHHPSRVLIRLAEAGYTLKAHGLDVRILSIGPAGPAVRAAMQTLPVIDLGPLPPDKISRYFRAMDIYCCPFIDGVSTRRGSFFAGLQHGLPVVTTDGYHTDSVLLHLDGVAMVAVQVEHPTAYADAVLRLARDPDARQQLGERARDLFESSFSQAVLAQRWRETLDAASGQLAMTK